MCQISTAQNLMLHDICNQILETDESIRFAGFANHMGTIIAAQHRESLKSVEKEKEQPLLTKNELELSAIESVLRMATRKDIMSKLGKPIYSFTLYEKVRRATILLENSNSNCLPILMVSFDNDNQAGTYQESIILNGILPLVSYYLSKVSPSHST
jgi:hypothetical protein